METMKAVRFHSYGTPEVLVYEDAPIPEPGQGEVRVRVHAAAVNPADWKFRVGHMQGFFDYQLPLILGLDVAGVVEKVGAGVEDVQVGDDVYAVLGMRLGGYAQYAVVTFAGAVAVKPKTLSYIEAASVPSVAMTAWQALFDVANLSPGQTVLIHGASGGVGMFAVQLAKLKGANVIGTASARNLDFLRELGASEVIDYNATQFEQVVSNVDVVLDTIGDQTRERSWSVLKPGGILVSTTSPPSQEQAQKYGVRASMVMVQSKAAILREIANLIDAGKIQTVVEKVFPITEASSAHELSQQGHARGKIVLQVV